jgi:NDP-mannose synthase
LLDAARDVHVRLFEGYWLDIGRPDDYVQAIDQFADMKARLLRE